VIQNTEFELVHGDCVEGMKTLAQKSVDVCVTSPPYNLGINYSKYDDTGRRFEYLAWTREWSSALHRILADNGSFFLNVGACPSNPMLPHEILFELKDQFVLQNTIHWIKSITVQNRDGESTSAGHFTPINSTSIFSISPKPVASQLTGWR
jgi:site-specific DNA-methyltransferase (adenine-specific)